MKKAMTLLGAVFGAGMAYLFDPDRGRSRRARLSDQVSAMRRDLSSTARKKVEYEKGVMKGVVHEATAPFRPTPEFSDDVLAQKVRSEALGPSGVSGGDIEIDVTDGVVVLTGSVSSEEARKDLVRRVERVAGVDMLEDRMAIEV